MNLRMKSMLVAMSLCIMNFAMPSDRATKTSPFDSVDKSTVIKVGLIGIATAATIKGATYAYQFYKQQQIAAERREIEQQDQADRERLEDLRRTSSAALWNEMGIGHPPRRFPRLAAHEQEQERLRERQARNRADQLAAEEIIARREMNRVREQQGIGHPPRSYPLLVAHDQAREQAVQGRRILVTWPDDREERQQVPQQAREAMQEQVKVEAARQLTSFVDALPQQKPSPEYIETKQRCSICLSKIFTGKNASTAIQTACNHLFHKQCMIGYLNNLPAESQAKTQDCPNCRATIRTLGEWNPEFECGIVANFSTPSFTCYAVSKQEEPPKLTGIDLLEYLARNNQPNMATN